MLSNKLCGNYFCHATVFMQNICSNDLISQIEFSPSLRVLRALKQLSSISGSLKVKSKMPLKWFRFLMAAVISSVAIVAIRGVLKKRLFVFDSSADLKAFCADQIQVSGRKKRIQRPLFYRVTNCWAKIFYQAAFSSFFLFFY